MTVQDEVKKAQANLDKLESIPSTPPQISGTSTRRERSPLTVNIPKTEVSIIYQEMPFGFLDACALWGMLLGLVSLGMAVGNGIAR